ncbi:MAG: hypothetical protein ACOY58_03720 [Candidatus Micrarchaeota archaeon]
MHDYPYADYASVGGIIHGLVRQGLDLDAARRIAARERDQLDEV